MSENTRKGSPLQKIGTLVTLIVGMIGIYTFLTGNSSLKDIEFFQEPTPIIITPTLAFDEESAELSQSTPTGVSSITPLATVPGNVSPLLRLTNDAPLYEGPGDHYSIMSTLIAGEVVAVIGQDMERVWCYIRKDDGGTGWVQCMRGYLLYPGVIHPISPTPEANSTLVNSSPTPPSVSSPLSSSPISTGTIPPIGGNLPGKTPPSWGEMPTTTNEPQIPDSPLPTYPPFQATPPPVLATERPTTPTPDIPPTADIP